GDSSSHCQAVVGRSPGLCAGLGAGPGDRSGCRPDADLTDSVERAADETSLLVYRARLTSGGMGVVGDADRARRVLDRRPAALSCSRAPCLAGPERMIPTGDLSCLSEICCPWEICVETNGLSAGVRTRFTSLANNLTGVRNRAKRDQSILH